VYVQRLVSVVKMATVLEKCTREEQRSGVPFLWAKGLNAKDIHKEMFTMASVCRVKRFTAGSRNSLKDFESRRLRQKQLCRGGDT
jgi:hypothetical protein